MSRTTITFIISDEDLRNEGVQEGQEYTWMVDGQEIDVTPTKIRSVAFVEGKWQVKADLRMTRSDAQHLDAHSDPVTG